MKRPKKDKAVILSDDNMSCHKCDRPMKKVSWKVTAGAFDAGQEVEQTVFQCSDDKNTLTIEVSTGDPSEFAVDTDINPDDWFIPQEP